MISYVKLYSLLRILNKIALFICKHCIHIYLPFLRTVAIILFVIILHNLSVYSLNNNYNQISGQWYHPISI